MFFSFALGRRRPFGVGFRWSAAYVVPVFLILVSGCQREDVHVYLVPKENSEAVSPASFMGEIQAPPAGPAAASSRIPDRAESDGKESIPAGGDLHWAVPKQWETVPAVGMRLASFSFLEGGSKADISVVVLPGMAGGILANINRWRGQLGLPPIDENGQAGNVQEIKSPAGQLSLVDLEGEDAKREIHGKARMIAAILSKGDRQWFFKAMGESSIIAKVKPSFLEFLGSLQFVQKK